jgi:2-dehydropantoate 2-reductase
MRFLIVGAGAIGGYFGGRLLEAGADVTFLVRPRRQAELKSTGLVITSSYGDVTIADPPTVLARDIDQPFDVVIASSKSYDLEGTITDFAAAVGPRTCILPLLNGMRHFDILTEKFGAQRVLGGLCFISSTLDEHGRIVHLNESHTLVFGELAGGISPRVDEIFAELSRGNFIVQSSADVMQDLWEKWTFIATVGALTTLMRATVGDVIAAGASDIAEALLQECSAIAGRNGHAPRPASMERARAFLAVPGSTLQASMAKDIERGARIEADHIIGDLLRCGGAGEASDAAHQWPLLRVAFAALKAYEARRQREMSS